jgi:hypothetical protein
MTPLLLALLLVQNPAQAPEPDSLGPEAQDAFDGSPVSPAPPDAYADDATRAVVFKARAYRGEAYLALREYSVQASSEVSMGVRALLRDRTIFKCQTAVEVTWRRYGISDVRVLGARYAVPIAGIPATVPEDLDDCAQAGLFDPGADRFAVFGDMVGGDGSDFSFHHPLARDAERHYRFALGDTTRIRLPDGQTVTLVELRVEARRNDADLLAGSLWIDDDSHAVVQVFVRPVRPADLERDFEDAIDEDDRGKIPGFMKPIQAEIRYIAVEYGLWAQRWWLPRLVAMEGVGRVGRFARFPLSMSQRYGAYEVVGDTTPLDPIQLDSLLEADRAYRDSVADIIEHAEDHADMDVAFGRRCNASADVTCWCPVDDCFLVRVETPDTATLLASEALPEHFLGDEEPLISEAELEDLGRRIADIVPPPWQVQSPRLGTLWGGPDLLRYNRVEGLSIGARADVDFGRLQGFGVARLGLAAFEPTAELGLVRERYRSHIVLTGYRRLAPIALNDRSLGFGNSVNALLLGRDDGDYFYASGAELRIRPPEDVGNPWELRLFAEGQRRARRETDFSLATLGDNDFRPNLRADRANQVGASLRLRHASGLDPLRFRWGIEGFLEGSTGTFDFVRPAATLRATVPLPRGLSLGLEGAAGGSLGEVPVQSLWLLGGPVTLRGYDGAARAGDGFWRGRAELAMSRLGILGARTDDGRAEGSPLRLSLFTDFGWAGDRSEWRDGVPLWSVGAGLSALDGLVRFDVARALRSPTDWRVHLYLDALL